LTGIGDDGLREARARDELDLHIRHFLSKTSHASACQLDQSYPTSLQVDFSKANALHLENDAHPVRHKVCLLYYPLGHLERDVGSRLISRLLEASSVGAKNGYGRSQLVGDVVQHIRVTPGSISQKRSDARCELFPIGGLFSFTWRCNRQTVMHADVPP
jgi:hypothetical protein